MTAGRSTGDGTSSSESAWWNVDIAVEHLARRRALAGQEPTAEDWNGALSELVKAFENGRADCWGRPLSNPASRHVRIEAAFWLSDVTIKSNRTTAADVEMERYARERLSRAEHYEDLKVKSGELIELAVHFKFNQRVTSERNLVEWLILQMRSAPEHPRPRGKMMEEAKIAGLKFTGRGFDVAWRRAIQDSGASRWSQSGRRPKSPREIAAPN